MHVEREESVKEKTRLSMNRSERHLIYLYNADNCAIKEKIWLEAKYSLKTMFYFNRKNSIFLRILKKDVNLYNFSFINLLK